MQIVLSHPPSYPPATAILEALTAAFQRSQSADTITSWKLNEPVPPGDFEMLLAFGPLTRDHLAACPTVALVHTPSAGYENVDIEAATDLGIWVSYSPSDRTGNADSVAEFAVLLLLAVSRGLLPAVRSIHDRHVASPVLAPALMGKSVCLVGIGGIGKALFVRLRPFGMHITAVNRHPENAPPGLPTRPLSDLKEAVAGADFVVLCLRATAENHHLIDASVLSAMKRGATLINIARGSLIDEAALHEALRDGHLRAAGLDVLEREPAESTDPLVQLPQVLVTPHLAGFTDVMMEGLIVFLLEIIDRFKRRQRFDSLVNNPPAPRVLLAN